MDTEAVERALALARRAPVPHGHPTWRWETAPGGVRLHTAPGCSPDDPGAVLAAGAALHHAVLALAAYGLRAEVTRLPGGPTHLATLELTARDAEPDDIDRLAAMVRRRTDHRRYAEWELDPGQIAALAAAAARADVIAGAAVGVAGEALLPAVRYAEEFADAVLASRTGRARSGPGTLLVLGTADDGAGAWLRAGEAMGAVLVEATALGLASCVLTHPLSAPGARAAVERELGAVPHVVVRVGQQA